MHWVLILYMTVNTNNPISVQGYETEKDCHTALSILLKDLKVPKGRYGCLPGADVVPGAEEHPHTH